MSSRFGEKKKKILALLDTPEDQYHDLSPKGSIDEPIRCLIDDINHVQELVTTSSCSGRISVFLEGKKKRFEDLGSQQVMESCAARNGPGGKGGGSWLYISHTPVQRVGGGSDSDFMAMFNMEREADPRGTPTPSCSYIHLKFEPMILHILTVSAAAAQRVLTAALNAGFRESGAVSIDSSKGGEVNPMVAVRSTGYSFDAIIGYQNANGVNLALVDEVYLQTLVSIANDRFAINIERMKKFRSSLLDLQDGEWSGISRNKFQKSDWEDAEVRRQRKRAEGLIRQKEMQAQ